MRSSTLLAALMLVLLAGTALADGGGSIDSYMSYSGQGSSPVSPSCVVSSIVGNGVVGAIATVGQSASCTASASSVMSSLMLIFNAALLGMGSLYFTWSLWSATVQSAQDGEMLGKRYNSLWMPVRTTFGISTLVPIFNGFSLSQIIMIWATMLGIGIGNAGSQSVVTFLTSGEGALVAMQKPAPPQASQFAHALFQAMVCSRTVNQLSNAVQAKSQANAAQLNDAYQTDKFAGASASKLSSNWFVTATGAQLQVKDGNSPIGNCGMYKLPSIVASTGGIFGNHLFADRVTATQQQIVQSVGTLVTNLDQIATQYVNNNGQAPYPGGQIEGVANQFSEQALAQIKAGEPDFLDRAKEGMQNAQNEFGWFSIGFFNFYLSQANQAYHSTASIEATVDNSGAAELIPTLKQTEIGSDFAVAMAGLHTREQDWRSQYDAGLQQTGQTQSKMDDWHPGDSLANFLIQRIATSSGGQGNYLINPLVASKNIGDVMLDIGAVVGTVGTVVEVGGSAVNAVGDTASALPTPQGKLGGMVLSKIGALAKKLGGMLTMLAMVGIVAGFLLGIYLPMVPFLHWIGLLGGWAMTFGESVISAPLWSFSHLEPEGEGMGQKTSHGYVFILRLAFFPFVAIFGFVLSTMISTLLGTLMIKGFSITLSVNQADSVTGLFSIFGYLLMFGIALMTLINAIYGQMYKPIEMVFAWIGAGVHNLSMHLNGEHAFQQATGAAIRGFRPDKPGGGGGQGKGGKERTGFSDYD
jgi:conjugal transfer/type IV secretion protein DotA/TraY